MDVELTMKVDLDDIKAGLDSTDLKRFVDGCLEEASTLSMLTELARRGVVGKDLDEVIDDWNYCKGEEAWKYG